MWYLHCLYLISSSRAQLCFNFHNFSQAKKKILCLGLQRGKKLGRSVGDNFFSSINFTIFIEQKRMNIKIEYWIICFICELLQHKINQVFINSFIVLEFYSLRGPSTYQFRNFALLTQTAYVKKWTLMYKGNGAS